MRPYCRLEHVAHSVWGARYTPEGLFAMLTCYFDDAGGVDHGFTLCAGWLSTVELWREFERMWNDLLKVYKLPYFTMKECAQWNGQFASWRGDTQKRNQFIRTAAQIIKLTALQGYATVVPHVGYKEANEIYTLREFCKSEYAFAGFDVVLKSLHWRDTHRPDDPIEFIFHDGTKGKGVLDALMKQELGYIPIFRFSSEKEGKNPSIQLQVADFLAYEVRKIRVDDPEEKKAIDDYRMSARFLVSVPNDWHEYYAHNLIETCERHPKIHRRG